MENKSIYPLDELESTLEERREFIKDHDDEMNYICSSLKHYIEDVEHAIDMGLSHSVVSHLTYNMVLTIAKGLTDLTIYYYLRAAYMLDDEYDTTYEIWKSVYDSANEIIPLLAKLQDENYFGEDINIEEFEADIVAPTCMKAQGKENYLNIYRIVALKSSGSLIHSLAYFLRVMVNLLNDLKVGNYADFNDEYDRIYEANYKLYKEQYWPTEGRHFRAHIEQYLPHYERLTPEYLGKLLWEEQKDFEHTPTGVLWRDFFIDKKDLYFEAKRIKLNEEQWKYFFKCICRFKEYERWIEELRNPPESEEDKQKRERLLKSNKVFVLKPAKSRYEVDILLLYVFIRDRFITEKMFVYEWYALYHLLKRYGIITSCTTKDFERQMNDKEWFADVEKKCSANEINTYGFLTDKSPEVWNVRFKPTGNRASKNSVENLYRKYSNLEDTIDEIYLKE
jgi:hypothetical protein